MAGRISLLMLTAGAAGAALIGNAMGLAAAEPTAPGGAAPSAPRSRLGVAIADDLGELDKAAVRRARALELREQAVRAAESRLKADGPPNPAAPAAGAASMPGTPGVPGAANGADQFDNLAQIYQAMKPAAAALVMEQLDLDVQMRVAQRMRERSTALIMGSMTPRGAAALTMALARRQAIPQRPPSAPARGR